LKGVQVPIFKFLCVNLPIICGFIRSFCHKRQI
jgi:hypothetical protein